MGLHSIFIVAFGTAVAVASGIDVPRLYGSPVHIQFQ